MALNIKLAKRLVTRFKRMRHPEHFNIKQIAVATECGAAMCFIGHTLDLAGYRMQKKEFIIGHVAAASRSDYRFISPAGREADNPYRTATRLLGLSDGQASALFCDWFVNTPVKAAARIQQLIDESLAK